MVYHKPVLMEEVITYLNPQPHGIYIDATFGGGGHTRAILRAQPTCKVISFDVDKNALDMNAPAVQEEFGDRWEYVWGNFSRIRELVQKTAFAHEIKERGGVDGILADFGTSQYQIKERAGFSFAVNSPLDMRMSSSHSKMTAADVVNSATEKELITIFFEYGEERMAPKIARAICTERLKKRIVTTDDLVKIILTVVPRKHSEHIHPATRVFQALRIVVNKELESIISLLKNSTTVLRPDGRLVCISFHSLEDRLVKQFFKEHKNHFDLLTPRVVIPTEQEIKENPSSRSSKLRAARYFLV